jgi:hypothetical protein
MVMADARRMTEQRRFDDFPSPIPAMIHLIRANLASDFVDLSETA